MHTSILYTGIMVIPVLLVLPVSGDCEKGDDRALYMTKCAAI
ncbi:hypothetical protein E2C01_053190 [Portunus trituberculatus]|uniref:Uncharacterized protein n=1 Tax=Portunus trituberculatus TaxID=210409 RepID=A0A5B7GRC4_PORTR|nr:hypothetical protein [Portunus trituberculatus]